MKLFNKLKNTKLLISVILLIVSLLLFVRREQTSAPPSIEQEATTEASICKDDLPQETAEAVTYDDLYQIMSELYAEQKEFDDFKMEGIQNTPFSIPETTNDFSFSDTNKQVTDVDEEDFIKTDGEYIYYIQETQPSSLRIVKADKGRLREMSTIVTKNSPYGFYLNGSQLILIEADTATRCYPQPIKPEIKTMSFSTECLPFMSHTAISFYDISDKLHPIKTNTLFLEGNYSSSRIHDGYLYIFTSFHLQTRPIYEKMDTYIPTINGEPLSADHIIIPEFPAEPSYLNIASVNLTKPETFTDYKAIVSGGNKHYFVSSDKIYVASGSSPKDFHAS